MQEINYEEDLDQIDFDNYKGYFYDDSEEKYFDKETGAHFDFLDICLKLNQLKKKLEAERDIRKPKITADLNIKGSLKEKLLRRAAESTGKGDEGTQKLGAGACSRNVSTQNTQVARDRPPANCAGYAGRARPKPFVASRNNSATKSFATRNIAEQLGGMTERSMKIDALCEMYGLSVTVGRRA